MINYLRFTFCSIPLFFALLSFYLKTKFVMKTDKQVEQIGIGIGLHLIGKPATCPMSGATISIFTFEGDDEYWHGVLGHFRGTTVMRRLMREGGAQELVGECRTTVIKASLTFASLLVVAVISTISLISGKWSFIPVLLIVCVGGLVIWLVFSIFTKIAAETLLEELSLPSNERTLTVELMERILEERRMLAATAKFKTLDLDSLNNEHLQDVDNLDRSILEL